LIIEEQSLVHGSETFRYQLPVKILDAADRISQKVMKLKKDAYGDLYYDIDSNSKEGKELKRTGEVMKYWVNKLLDSEELQPHKSIFAQKVDQQDFQTQVDMKDFLASEKSIGNVLFHQNKI